MRPSLNIDLPDPEWLILLRQQQANGKSVAQIAREIGVPRPSVSMLLSGTYPARSLDLVTRKHGAAVIRLYRDQVLCPHLRRGLTPSECQAFARAPMSTSNPDKLQHWRACQRCPLRAEVQS